MLNQLEAKVLWILRMFKIYYSGKRSEFDENGIRSFKSNRF